METTPRYDEVGNWSEVKLDIISEYSKAYSTIISSQTNVRLKHVYIDAFAGAGKHISRKTGGFIPGSPVNALNVKPPFAEYYFIDLDTTKVKALMDEAGKRSNVHVFEGDCNVVLNNILPNVRYEDYRRALCILDPYGLHLNWDIIYQIGQMKSVEIFLNFPVADINRNVLWKYTDQVPESQIKRMNAFWGDESWRDVAYKKQPTLFGDEDVKTSNEDVAEGFRKRLINVAGFKFSPKPIAMKNSQKAIVYYLFFASHNATGEKIAKSIFKKYSLSGGA